MRNPTTPMFCTVETITPEMAKAILAGNTGNRAIRANAVRNMADDMRRGFWRLTHQGIAIAQDGRLLDGQHRLHAILDYGQPVEMMVARNVDPAAFSAMDRGRVRQVRDILQQDGRLIDPCGFIARLHGRNNVEAHHTQEVLDGCGNALVDLLAEAGAVARGRTAAPIKAAAALRLMQGHRDYVLPQWRAWVGLQFAHMSPAIQALCRQITDENRNSARGKGSTLQNDRAARAWIAFDPARRNVTKIQVNDIGSILDEMRAVWRPSWGL